MVSFATSLKSGRSRTWLRDAVALRSGGGRTIKKSVAVAAGLCWSSVLICLLFGFVIVFIRLALIGLLFLRIDYIVEVAVYWRVLLRICGLSQNFLWSLFIYILLQPLCVFDCWVFFCSLSHALYTESCLDVFLLAYLDSVFLTFLSPAFL